MAKRQTCIRFRRGSTIPEWGPEHSYWKATGRVKYISCADDVAMTAFDTVSAKEGILPALESSHGVAKAMEIASQRSPEEIVVICLSGRGDKDASEIRRLKGEV